MKKKLTTIIAGMCAAVLLVGCGGNGGTISNENIKINKYKGLEVEKVETIAVTDADVEDSIKSDLETIATTTEVTDRPAQEGDITTIDFVGKKDGVAFDGGSGTDQELELGSGRFIPGFEDGIVGHSIGETFDLNLTFPETYSNSPEMAGQAVVFTVTLKGLKEKHVPELTEDVLEQLGSKAKTVEEYKAQVRTDLETSNKETAESNLLNALWNELVENCEIIKYPSGMVDEYVSGLKEQYSYYAQMYNMEFEEFFQQMFGISVEEAAKMTATQELAVSLIAEKEKLTISDKEYKAELKELAAQYNYEDSEKFESAYGKDTIRKAMLQEKVGQLLLDNCVQVEAKENKEK